jgi:hypothetical protein
MQSQKQPEAVTQIEIQIHPTKDLYRYVGPHGPSQASSRLHDIMKLVRFVYDDVEVTRRIAEFEA